MVEWRNTPKFVPDPPPVSGDAEAFQAWVTRELQRVSDSWPATVVTEEYVRPGCPDAEDPGDGGGPGTGGDCAFCLPDPTGLSEKALVSNGTNALWDRLTTALMDHLRAASGAVTRTLRDKLSDEVYVTDWGASPSASASANSAAFQAALNYLQNSGGGTLIIPRGTYSLNIQLTYENAPLVVRGAGGQGTTLKWQSGSGYGFSVSQSNAYSGRTHFENLRLVSNVTAATNNSAAILFTNLLTSAEGIGENRFSVNNVVIHGGDSGTSASRFISGSTGWRYGIYSVGARQTSYSNIEIVGQAVGYAAMASAGMIAGIVDYSPTDGVPATNHFFENVQCWYAAKGIYLAANAAEGAIIHRCVAVACIDGVFADPNDSEPIATRPMVNVHNCHMAVSRYGIYLRNITQSSIIGNLIYKRSDSISAGAGIYVTGGYAAVNGNSAQSGAQSISIMNNHVSKSGGAYSQTGIHLQGETSLVTGSNDTTSASGYKGVHDCKVIGNALQSCDVGIKFGTNTYSNRQHDNIFISCTAKFQDDGVFYDGAGNQINNYLPHSAFIRLGLSSNFAVANNTLTNVTWGVVINNKGCDFISDQTPEYDIVIPDHVVAVRVQCTATLRDAEEGALLDIFCVRNRATDNILIGGVTARSDYGIANMHIGITPVNKGDTITIQAFQATGTIDYLLRLADSTNWDVKYATSVTIELITAEDLT